MKNHTRIGYDKVAVNRAIAGSSRHGAAIDRAEAAQIHRILSGRCGDALEVTQIVEIPRKGPGGKLGRRAKPAMSKERFLAGIAALGHNINTANQILGVGRSTIYRMASGRAAVPAVIARLMDMYERFGIPPEHRP
jgi:hypothetical protein